MIRAPRLGIRSKALTAVAGLTLAACASTPEPAPRVDVRPIEPVADFQLSTVRFSDLPSWSTVDLGPALTAFRRQCAVWRARPNEAVSASARYGGQVSQWLPACNAADAARPGGERAFFEANFVPYAISGGTAPGRLTGYFEPVIRASRTPAPGYSEPVLSKPADLVTVDLAGFAEAYDSEALRGLPRQLNGKLHGSEVRPYPSRAQIVAAPPSRAIGYANPADLYNLQVQGSGQLEFLGGGISRAAFAAQNGYRWRSAIAAARDAGRISDPNWRSFRNYLDGLPVGGARGALNADPSYVFFAEEPLTDPTAGPKGAAGVPLTAEGSVAVDPAYHPYGALLFVDATYAGDPFRRLAVAQDTGGAIRRGPLRGDLFFGAGPAAGERAERMNSEGVRFWTLAPRGLAVGPESQPIS
jgi:membrane-bound lytic murein transglycosylase A